VLTRLARNVRRAGLLSLALLAFIAPAPTQADPGDFVFEVLRNRCVNTGKDFGHGEVLLKVKVKENGASGANKFTLAAVAQHLKPSTGTWVNEYTFDFVKVTFPDDANSYYHERWFAYDPKESKEHRIVLVMKILHNKQVLASRTVTSKSC
jgi:hypothetical protein